MTSLNITAIDAAVASGDTYSDTISTQGLTKMSVQAVLEGATTPDVDILVYGSNQPEEPGFPSDFALLGSSLTLTSNTTQAVAFDCVYRWITVRAVNGSTTSGGTVSVYVFGNGPN